MKEVEGFGKNIEQAIEDALFQIKAPREDVDIKILCEGGLFKKAKVVVSISEDAKGKYAQKEEIRKEIKKDDDCIIISKKEIKEEVKQEKVEKIEDKEEKIIIEKEDKKERISQPAKVIDVKEFLTNIFQKFGAEVEIEEIEDERSITYSIKGEKSSQFIGYRGEALSALSLITSMICEKSKKRVLVDIEGYRERRVESLQNLAKRTAEKVSKTGRYVKLEPMNPAERRIIHMALQENENVTTLSKGTEPRRYLMIFPRNYENWVKLCKIAYFLIFVCCFSVTYQ